MWIFIAVTHFHRVRNTHTHTHTTLKQDLETSGQLSSQELSDTIETCMHTNTHTQQRLLPSQISFKANVGVGELRDKYETNKWPIHQLKALGQL